MPGWSKWTGLFALAVSLKFYHVQNADINPRIHQMPCRG